MHNTHLPPMANNLKNILGNHLINRNVLLSSSVDSNYHSNNYAWTTAYLTLMSGCQLGNGSATTTNKYDDGEANYKLPLFSNDASRKSGSYFWTRGVWGYSSSGCDAWGVYAGGTFGNDYVDGTRSVRPLIYIR